jgi:flagellar hook-associated protein 3 FlgL
VSFSRVTNGMVRSTILSDLNRISDQLTKTQLRASSGKQLTKPSDDPYGTARALALQSNVAATKQFQKNVSDGIGWMNATEQAFDSMTQSLHRAQELVVQGANGTLDGTSRSALADEIDQIIAGLKQDANTKYGTSYLFAGSKTDTQPYPDTVDGDGIDDVYRGDLGGSDPTQVGVARQIGPGVSLTINTVAGDVLGSGQAVGDGKLLNTLRDISEHLRSGDTTALSGADQDRLQAGLDTLLEARAANGAKTNRLDAAAARLEQLEGTVTEQLSDTTDADFAQTMIDLSSQTAAYQAALRSGANIVQSSLMDFLR